MTIRIATLDRCSHGSFCDEPYRSLISRKGQKVKHSFQATDEELRAQRITKAVIACYFAISAIIVGAVYLQGTPALSESRIIETNSVSTAAALTGEATQIGEVAFLLSECAKRDLEMLIEIELEANDHAVTPTEIANATFKLLDARAACRDGRFAEAFMTYDDGFAPSVALATGRKPLNER